ncbi:hypothetical protein [Marinobacter sp. X15-166B]|uniref:T4 family baseplate hub assembly chaperone n=1 Tax=Marinobacter sp. X15-166B TaxID=1897620 RepID=UPI00085C497D|nr:hypothetical protein [Marinobacter sp. X15-166B]OEY66748.1 hypothetical protein BG841_09980 [Marinobacter sp. X15-166B]
MITPGAEQLLNVWEQGLNQPLLQRALMLLAVACPDCSPDTLATLSIGERDSRLLQLRARLFGQQLSNTAVCPQCNERLEWQSCIADLLVDTDRADCKAGGFELQTEGYQLRFRLPNSLDVAAAANAGGAEDAVQQLLLRCVIEIEQDGVNCANAPLPEGVVQALAERMEALDPQADIRTDLTCPECAHHWCALFDIASFLWAEVNGWAERMLHMVCRLAAAYGWSERDILNLSPVRRQLYLGMVAR